MIDLLIKLTIFSYVIYMLYTTVPKKSRIASILLFILIVFISVNLLTHLKNRCNELIIHTFTSDIPGPTMVAVAGSHGNEPGGTNGLYKLIHELKEGTARVKTGTLIILPELNRCGLKLGIRYLPQELLAFNVSVSDLNRNYANKLGEEGKCTISKEVETILKKADYVYDGHEGYDFTKLVPESMGSGIYPSQEKKAQTIASHLTESINQSPLLHDKEDYKKFITRDNWSLIDGSLRKYCQNRNIPYILVETTGQNDIQPLDVRGNQHHYLCKKMAQYIGILD